MDAHFTREELDALAALAGIHPDFCRIAELVCDMDEVARHTDDPTELIGDRVHAPSLVQAARNRIIDLIEDAPPALALVLAHPEISAVLGAVWADGFSVGVDFQRSGGHEA